VGSAYFADSVGQREYLVCSLWCCSQFYILVYELSVIERENWRILFIVKSHHTWISHYITDLLNWILLKYAWCKTKHIENKRTTSDNDIKRKVGYVWAPVALKWSLYCDLSANFAFLL
jgi:hypothetical protein